MVLGISARDLVTAATDPRSQALVAAAAQAYAPAQTKKVTDATQQALQHYRQARALLRPPAPRRPAYAPMPMAPPAYADEMPASPPVKKSNVLTYAVIGAAGLVILLVMRK